MNPALRTLTDAERLDWLRLTRSENVGPRTFLSLIERCGTAGAALAALPGLVRRRSAARTIQICSVAAAEAELERAAKRGIVFLALCEPAYPALLRAIDSPPPLIGVAGRLDVLDKPTVAIVGSRNASGSGLILTERFAKGLGAAGYAVVSGLARGIDGKAHQSSLETGTVAVMAGGHDRIYPAEHEALARRIMERGALVSEMPLGWEARARDFPRRNRIVAGLSLGTVVVEASRRSGSLITARFANEQGREVFAVPGSPLDARAEGTNDLLRQGATLCTSVDDVLSALAPLRDGGADARTMSEPPARDAEAEPLWDELDLFEQPDGSVARWNGFTVREPEPPPSNQPDGSPGDLETTLLGLLGPVPMSVDDLIRASGLAPNLLQATLVELEIEGRIRRLDGNRIALLIEA